MNAILRWLLKDHDWLYKGDGTRICMVCGRVEQSKHWQPRREPAKTVWQCVKRGDETKRPCGTNCYDDFGFYDRGPDPREQDGPHQHQWTYPHHNERWCLLCKRHEMRKNNMYPWEPTDKPITF